MRTIRGRVTLGYGVALAATLFVFAYVIYSLPGTASFTELDARAKVESDLIASVLVEAYKNGQQIVQADPDTLVFGPPELAGRPVLAPRLSGLLASVEDYVMILDPQGNILYSSEEARGPEVSVRVFEELAALAREPAGLESFGLHDLGPPIGEIRYYVRPIAEAGDEVASILSGASTMAAPLVLEPQRLLLGMLAVGPIVLLASIAVGYFMAGRALQPVDTIIDEIQAITDGRSLHRRVIEFGSFDELARLTSTLNNMLVRLERSFLSLRRFTADASHELKTPLTVLRSGVERTITHPKAHPEVMETLEEMLVEVNRMTELVDSLLTLARVDEGRAPLHLEPQDLRELMTELVETASMLGEDASVEVEARVPPGPIVVPMDRSRMRQLLMNLVTNAIKYTPKGGRVVIQCAVRGEAVEFAVTDTGIGISGTELPHVFDRFWRADVSRSRSGQRPGAGLGLAISKWIAEAHGGTITVDSRLGRGSTFTVTLPAVEPATRAAG